MTPLAIEMLVWFHTRGAEAGPFPNIKMGSPQGEIVAGFLAEGIIEAYEGTSPLHTYRTTDRGKAWLTMMLDTPMPKQVWIDPRRAA